MRDPHIMGLAGVRARLKSFWKRYKQDRQDIQAEFIALRKRVRRLEIEVLALNGIMGVEDGVNMSDEFTGE